MKTLKGTQDKTDAKRKMYFSLAFIVLMLFVSNITVAQDKFSIALGGGINLPTQDLGDADLDTGFGFEGTIAYSFLPHLSVYTGWGWNKFSSGNSFAGGDTDFEETGYTFGLRFQHPLSSTNLDYILGIGGVYNHIEIEDNKGNNIADSGHDFGWQADAGISLPLSDRLAIVPGVRFRYLQQDIEIEENTFDADLQYLALTAAIKWFF